MKIEDIDRARLAAGDYCHKGAAGCCCAVGWPYELQCPACRDKWKEGQFRDSYCICPPVDHICPPSAQEKASDGGGSEARWGQAQQSLLEEMSRMMAQIQERREDLVRAALGARCSCGAPVRTAKWVVTRGESPLVERLLCMCDAGHEWFWRFETCIEHPEGGGVRVRMGTRRERVPLDRRYN